MLIRYEEVQPYLEYLDYHDPTTLCGWALFEQLDTCVGCRFSSGEYNTCSISSHNEHFPQLLRTLKLKHPELFV